MFEPGKLLYKSRAPVITHSLNGTRDLRIRTSKAARAVEMNFLKEFLEPTASSRNLLGIEEDPAGREDFQDTRVKFALIVIAEMVDSQGRNDCIEWARRQGSGKRLNNYLRSPSSKTGGGKLEHFRRSVQES
jgi:hypothetical protein